MKLSAVGDADFDVSASAYSTPSAMRAGFEFCRAFERDIEDNGALLAKFGRLTIPILAVGDKTRAQPVLSSPR